MIITTVITRRALLSATRHHRLAMMAQKSSFSYDVMRSRHDDDGSDEEARASFAKAFNVDGPLREVSRLVHGQWPHIINALHTSAL